ncbi:trimethylamine methyltransferase family protein [Eubacterium callanderi]|uniref:trimethylamine methyltransferase family protein n=1 Tax=Eubacterium callanderi TaxID=53442 RepID=UPI001C2D202A|nr:trimethylamine methyltransferase family protein [Eubacterium callanderi]MBV1684114.1 trimethylamine methyltransferase family protein [Eubacterium callanderi]
MLNYDGSSLFISKNDIETIHEYTLKTLSEVGMVFDHPEALAVFKKHGARIEGETVFLSEEIINRAIATVPDEFELFGRRGTLKIGRRYEPKVGPATDWPIIIDEQDNMRSATFEDALKFYKLMETSDVLDFAQLPVTNMPEFGSNTECTYLSQIALMLKYTSKFYANPARPNRSNVGNKGIRQTVREYHELLKRFYGVEDKYLVLELLCVQSPLCNDEEMLDNLLAATEAKQPISVVIASMTNVTSPSTLFGTAVHDNAVALATTTLIQLLCPGLPVVHTILSSPSDMRYMQMATGSAENSLLAYAGIAMGRYYGIPVRGGGTLSDAVDVDYQTGAEAAMTIMPSYLSNVDYITHAAGGMGVFNVGSFEKFVLDEELIGYMKRLYRGMDISSPEKAFEQMKKVGPRGNYVMGRTPKEYKRDTYFAKLFNKKGGMIKVREDGTLRERTVQEINRRIESYELPSVDKEQEKILNSLLQPLGL